ncbi:UNVERIFIED_CONTAM: hypothetical protein Slati_2127100 [Sesamum latifolium]|uniref:Reverse transcriptase zinc-binding domain-containing protein n=1 Tax=Sesamum latifolium TaxID=2727402 RepID=A0AAW2WSW2_9LAMI
MDKSWLAYLEDACILCVDEQSETHAHLFFDCRYSCQCLAVVRAHVRFPWPNHEWETDIAWAAHKRRGRHVIYATYRALLAALVYHLWQERNRRKFQQIKRTADSLASLVVEEIRQRILSADLTCKFSTIALFRLWRIPWHTHFDAY